MQPARANTGMSGSSLLLHSLQVYLNNQNRLQPIIGLSSVTECVKAGTGGYEVLYLCEACSSRVGKADIRSHIMGSLHRCNYIKVWHPYIMGGWEIPDLSKLAWPLMEMARALERTEGPGDVQVMEMEPAAYDMIASLSEAEAISFLHAVKDGRWAQLYSSVQSASSLAALTQSQEPSVDFTQSRKPSVEMTRPPAPPPTVSTVQLDNSVMLSGTNQMPLKPPGQYEHSNVFLHGYTGTDPIIGLGRVVECRGEEDGHPHCFLCHSCRVKTLHDGVIHHLTSSSHYYNYMVERHPECEGAVRSRDRQCLLSMAHRVEQQDGRGQVKVKWLPTSLCIQLAVNSYHWCIRTLGDGNAWTPANKPRTQRSLQGRKSKIDVGIVNHHVLEQRDKRIILCEQDDVMEAIDGPSAAAAAAEAPGAAGTRKRAGAPSTRQGRKRKKKDPVFKVSLPLNYGPLVMQRTSFSLDALPVVLPLPPDPPSPSPEPPLPQPGHHQEEFISSPLFVDRRHDDDFFAEERRDLFFAARPALLAEERESQHEQLFGRDADAFVEQQESYHVSHHKREHFGVERRVAEEEDRRGEDCWDTWGPQEARDVEDAYFTDGHRFDRQRNPAAEESHRINVWFN